MPCLGVAACHAWGNHEVLRIELGPHECKICAPAFKATISTSLKSISSHDCFSLCASEYLPSEPLFWAMGGDLCACPLPGPRAHVSPYLSSSGGVVSCLFQRVHRGPGSLGCQTGSYCRGFLQMQRVKRNDPKEE